MRRNANASSPQEPSSKQPRYDKNGYIDKNVIFTTEDGKDIIVAAEGSFLYVNKKGRINKTCHGCHNELEPTEPLDGARKSGFLACCNTACQGLRGKQGLKTWCEVCLRSIRGIPAETWTEGWVLGNDENPQQSEQKEDWHCPHCLRTAGKCPAPHCSSNPKKTAASRGVQLGNPHHDMPLQPAGSTQADKEAQCREALAQFEQGEALVWRLSSNALALSAWDAKNCKFKAANVQSTLWHNLPVVVSRDSHGQLSCCGPNHSCTCQPRGQCIHIHLARDLSLFEVTPATTAADSTLQGEEDRTAGHMDAGECCSSDDGEEASALEPGSASTLIVMLQGRSAVPLHSFAAADAVEDSQFHEGVLFMVSSGPRSNNTSFNWVAVKDGKWRCSAKEHGSNSHLRPCKCMDEVMGTLALTKEDLDDIAALGALYGDEPDQEPQARSTAPPISWQPRTMQQKRASGPSTCHHLIPEVLAQMLGSSPMTAGLLEYIRTAEDTDAAQQQVKAILEAAVVGLQCSEHSHPLKVDCKRVQVIDGHNPVRLDAIVYWVECKPPLATSHSQAAASLASSTQQQAGVDAEPTPEQTHTCVPCCYNYDGLDDDLFNLNNMQLMTHRFLLHVLVTCRYHGSSFNAVREVMLAMHRTLPENVQKKLPSLPILIRAFFGWLELLTELPGFTCPICKEFPEILVVDGTGFKVFDEHTADLLSFGHPTHDQEERVSFYRLSQRKLVQSAAARKLLLRFSQARPTKECTPLSVDELGSLKALLQGSIGLEGQQGVGGQRAAGPSCLVDLLRVLPVITLAGDEECLQSEPWIAATLYHLGCEHSSDTALIQSQAAYDAIQYLSRTGWGDMPPAVQAILAQDARVLLDLYVGCRGANPTTEATELERVVVTLIEAVAKLWHAIIGVASPAQSKSVELRELAPEDARRVTAMVEQQQRLAVYSNWQGVRHTRPQYVQHEHANGRSRDASVYRKCDNSKPLVGNGQRKFSPGMCKVSCPHSVCQGIHFFKDPESPSDIFTVLLTLFPRDKLPRVVFYDNGCKLYEYILNREPWMLQHMSIFVDAFHFGSSSTVPIHKCPAVFNGKEHSVARLFNSQVEEQGNAFVALHKRSARTMSLDRARKLISVLMQLWNGSRIDSLRDRQGALLSQWVQQYAEAKACLHMTCPRP